jgi:hypothetical protein
MGNSTSYLAAADTVNASVYGAVAAQMKEIEETEVRAVMKAYYSAFNRMNFAEIATLWLPDDSTELALPGFARAVCLRCWSHHMLRPLYLTARTIMTAVWGPGCAELVQGGSRQVKAYWHSGSQHRAGDLLWEYRGGTHCGTSRARHGIKGSSASEAR